MKSVLQAAWLLTVAVGNIIVLVVAQFSGLVQVRLWGEQELMSIQFALQLPRLPFSWPPDPPSRTARLDNRPGQQIDVLCDNNDHHVPMEGRASEPSALPRKCLKWWLLSHPPILPLFKGFLVIFSFVYFSLQWAEFVLFSCLLLVVCLIFSIMGYYYVPLMSEGIHEPTDKQLPFPQGNMINLETKNTRLWWLTGS